MQNEKRWVIAGFGLMAGAMIVVFAINMHRESRRFGADGGNGGVDARQVASAKELAAAIKNPETRHEAIDSLSGSAGNMAQELLAALAHKNKDPEVRAAALEALGDIGDEAGLQVMTIGARDPNVAVRLSAVVALGKMSNEVAYSAVAEALANDIDVAVRAKAAEVLAAGKGVSVTLKHLVARMRAEENVDIRSTIALALGKLTNSAARSALISALDAENETEGGVRFSALKALDAVDDDARVQGVACAIGDEDERVRAEAKRIFGELGVEALPAVAKALKSGELRSVIGNSRAGAGVHGDILEVVAAMKSPDAAEPLACLLDLAVGDGKKTGDRPGIRDRASRALLALGAASVPPIAGRVLKRDARWPLRLAGAKVLAGIGDAAVAPIVTHAKSRVTLASTEEAGLWIETLEAIGTPAARKAVDEVKQRDPEVVFEKLAKSSKQRLLTRPPAPQIAEYRLILYRAFYGGNPPSAYTRRKNNLHFVKRNDSAGPPTVRKFRMGEHNRRTADLHLTRCADGWGRVFAHNLGYNNGVSFAQVTHASVTDEKMELDLRLVVGSDPWLRGGYGEYTVTLERTGDGEYGLGDYRGRYKGKYHNQDIEGVAVCTRAPKRPPLRPGWTPVQPNEHPRMLFRKCDLPLLRAKLNTPLGKAAFRRMLASGSGPALGLAYRLTGDERYAMEAIEPTRKRMANKSFGMLSLGQVWGPRFSSIAEAYDLCYDAWPASFRSEVERYLYKCSVTTVKKMVSLSVCANDHPCSNYFSPICGGGAMLALAYYGVPGPPPLPPGGSRLYVPAKFEGMPADGVPVLPLVPNRAPGTWLWSGPVLNGAMTDGLIDALGDTGTNPIREGRTFQYNEREYRFRPIESRYMQGGMVYPWPALASEYPDCASAGMLLHVILENHRPGFYRVNLPRQGSGILRANGTVLPDRSFVELREGLYSLLFSYVGSSDMVAGIGVMFEFMTSDRDEIQILIKEEAEKNKQARLLYDLALADHRATGMDGNKINTFWGTVVQMFRSHRLLMGDGGYQSEGEGYTHTAATPVRYASAHYNVFGQTATPYPDVTHFPTRYIATSALHPGYRNRKGRIRRPSLHSDGFYGGGGGTHGVSWICLGFPMIAEEHKPAVLWVWNKLKGVEQDKPETLARLVEGLSGTKTIATFVNYPLDPATGKTSIEPVHPSKLITKNWAAKTKGVYVFRNRWRNSDDIILLASAYTLKTHGNSGPDVAGLRLRGFGRPWAAKGGGKESPPWLNNIPILLQDGRMISGPGPARVLAYGNDGNGSGYLTIDMDNVYSPDKRKSHDRGGVWPPELPEERGPVTGVRAIAVDYSGKCGAPGLFVIVDKIVGECERHWVWHPAGPVTATNNTFTMTGKDPGGATVRGTFIPVPGLVVDAPGRIAIAEKAKSKKGGAPPKSAARRFGIAATAAPGQSFFLVMTMQKGAPPPEVAIEGGGLGAVVRIGKRQVRFDGEKAVIEDLADGSRGE